MLSSLHSRLLVAGRRYHLAHSCERWLAGRVYPIWTAGSARAALCDFHEELHGVVHHAVNGADTSQ